jgi:hypothetical protein
MKRIEVVITPLGLDAFKDAATRLGISEFDLIQVYRSVRPGVKLGSRFDGGCEFTSDMVPRLRVEFVLFDDALDRSLRTLRELVTLESVTIFTLDHDLRSLSMEHSHPSNHFSIDTNGLDMRCNTGISQAAGQLSEKNNNDQDADTLPRSNATFDQHRSSRL